MLNPFRVFGRRALPRRRQPVPCRLALEPLEDRQLLSATATVTGEIGPVTIRATHGAHLTLLPSTNPGEVNLYGVSFDAQFNPIAGTETQLLNPDGTPMGSITSHDILTNLTDLRVMLDKESTLTIQNVQIGGDLLIEGVDLDTWLQTPSGPELSGGSGRRQYNITLDGIRVQGNAEISGSDASLVQGNYNPPTHYTQAALTIRNSNFVGRLQTDFAYVNMTVDHTYVDDHFALATADSGNVVHLLHTEFADKVGIDLQHDWSLHQANDVQMQDDYFDDDLDVNVGSNRSTVTFTRTHTLKDVDLRGDSSTGYYDQGGNWFHNGIRTHYGISKWADTTTAQTGLAAAGPSGPRVVQSQLFLDHARLLFDEVIAAGSFTPDKAAVYDQAGVRGVMLRVVPVANSAGYSFDVYFRPFASGGYRLVVGPNITDLLGNPMNQNGNSVNGETPGDQYVAGDFVKPQVVTVTPAWRRLHVEFNKEIDPATFTPASVTLSDWTHNPVPVIRVSPSYWSGNTAFDIELGAIPQLGYHLTIAPTITDPIGNRMAAPFVKDYADPGPPHVVGIIGARAFWGITVQFSAPMDVSRVTMAAVALVDRTTGRAVPVSAVNLVPFTDDTTFDIRFMAAPGSYHLTLGPNLFDAFGLRMATAYQADFPLQITQQPSQFVPLPGTSFILPLVDGGMPQPVNPIDPVAGGDLVWAMLSQPATNLGTLLTASGSLVNSVAPITSTGLVTLATDPQVPTTLAGAQTLTGIASKPTLASSLDTVLVDGGLLHDPIVNAGAKGQLF
jgi:hypothetical protein